MLDKWVELALPCAAIATLGKHVSAQKAPNRLATDAHLTGNFPNANAVGVQLAHLSIALIAL